MLDLDPNIFQSCWLPKLERKSFLQPKGDSLFYFLQGININYFTKKLQEICMGKWVLSKILNYFRKLGIFSRTCPCQYIEIGILLNLKLCRLLYCLRFVLRSISYFNLNSNSATFLCSNSTSVACFFDSSLSCSFKVPTSPWVNSMQLYSSRWIEYFTSFMSALKSYYSLSRSVCNSVRPSVSNFSKLSIAFFSSLFWTIVSFDGVFAFIGCLRTWNVFGSFTSRLGSVSSLQFNCLANKLLINSYQDY